MVQPTNPIARKLRRNPTDAERRLWRHIRLGQIYGCKFRRQHPVGRYIVDFVCLEKMLALEVDGGQHNESQMDADRTKFLEKKGYRVLRFWNHEVLGQTDAVLSVIARAVDTPPVSSPKAGGEKKPG